MLFQFHDDHAMLMADEIRIRYDQYFPVSDQFASISQSGLPYRWTAHILGLTRLISMAILLIQ